MELYGLRDDAQIARELNRPVQSVRKMAESLFPTRKRTGPWSAKEVQNLKKYLGATTEETIARILGRPVDEVRRQITDLGRLQTNARWTSKEIAQFKRLYGTRTDDDLALIFGRPIKAIRQLAEKHALAKDKAFLRRVNGEAATRMPRWTDAELAKLKEMYPRQSNLVIAQALKRSVKSVVSKAHNLGLKKAPERLEEMGRQNVQHRYKG